MTLIRKIKGFTSKTGLKKKPLVVHFTSDNLGETLSIGSEELDVQYTVKYSDIERIVAREREKGYKDGHLIIYEDGEKS
jgi:hypothetical protein